MSKLVIAIDGPSGAGKGTVARAVAAALGYLHVDSGAMYRAVGWKALRDGIALDDEGAIAMVAQTPIEISPGESRSPATTSRARSPRRRSTAPPPRWRACRASVPCSSRASEKWVSGARS